MITMRCAGQEERWVLREELAERLRDSISELVLREPVPHVEKEATTRLQDAIRFPVTLGLVRKKHDTKLACHNIKDLVIEWQGDCVRLPRCAHVQEGAMRAPA